MNPTNDLQLDETPDETALRLGTTDAATDDAAADDAATGDAAADTAAATDVASAADAAEVEPGSTADDPAAAEAPPALQVEATDFAAKRAELRTKEAEIEKKWSAGELSDDERVAQLGAVRDESDQLLIAQTEARTLANINEQNARAANQAVIENLRKQGIAAGLDYKPGGEHAIEFDAQIKALATHDAWKGKTFAEAAAEAHRRVTAIFGKAPAPTPAAAAAPAADPAKPAKPAKPAIPPTLGDLPAAGAPALGNGLMESLQGADPDEAEAMLARTPAREKEQLLRSTMPTTAKRR